MKLKKRNTFKILALILVCCFCASFVKQDNVSAYFHTNQSKTAQCFAVSYERSEYHEGAEYMQQGEKVNNDYLVYNNYATEKICAYIDKDGKVTGKLVHSGKYPPDTTAIRFYPSLTLTASGDGIVLTDCANGDHWCFNVEGGGRQTETFPVGDYTTFYDLAKAVNDAAQSTYSNATKQALKDDNGSEVATGVNDAKDKAVDEQKEVREDDDAPVCYANSGALGWVLCPIITMASGIGEGMWNQIEEHHMKVPAQQVFESGGGVETAWSAVRDIANIVFIILLLLVIFSQLTGVGIDNYGIKKILPKLVVVAVLMNLSYLICELAVDISNILGTSLNGLLSSQADAIEIERAMDEVAANASGSLQFYLGSGALVFFTFLKEGSLLGAAGSIGLAVAGIVLIIVIAMLTLYVILTIREAGIIIAVVLAPVALVCYMLPNTEKLYKKWFDIFKALLLVYPICGAMVGAGKLAGAVLSTIDNPSMKIAAAIVQVVPFFLVPMVLKNSLSALGNIGARLSNFGRGLGRRASGGLRDTVRGTDRYKEAMEDARERTAAMRAQRVQERLGSRREGLNDRQLRRLRRADDTMLAYRNNQLKDEDARSGTNYAARIASMEANAYEEGLDQEIALLRQNGVNGQQYGLDSISGRLNQLRTRNNLTAEEQREIAILSRAAMGERGGGGAVGGMLRDNSTSTAFKMAMGDTLQRDSATRAKLAEKDAAASVYGESFMPNGSNRNGPAASFEQHSQNHTNDINNRIRTHEAALSQSGAALNEYIDNLTAQECQDIYDTDAHRVLSRDDLARFQARASSLGVNGKSAQRVIVDGNQDGT